MATTDSNSKGIRRNSSRLNRNRNSQTKRNSGSIRSEFIHTEELAPRRREKEGMKAVHMDSIGYIGSNKTVEAEKEIPMKPTSVAAANLDVQHISIESSREAIIGQLGGVVWEESFEYFQKQVLPPILPEFDVERILKRCCRSKILKRDGRSKKYSWILSAPRPEGRKPHHEEDCIPLLKKILDAITDVALKDVKSPKPDTTCYLDCDRKHVTWPTVDRDIIADAHLVLTSSDNTYTRKNWYNIAFSIHSNESLKMRYQNIEHMLQSLHHQMVIDPCRRFTLGATIEETRMRLWLYTRSTTICSEEFDFCSDPKTIIKIVLSLIFADKCDLGWDPTVNAKYDGRQRLLEFEVSGKHYRTSPKNILSDDRAGGIHTSATRIFKAFRTDDKDEKYPVVIKDFWPGEKYKTEDVIRDMILDDISDPEERDIVLNMTLTPIVSGRVKVEGEEDHTEKTILRGKSPLRKYNIVLQNERNGGRAGSMTGDLKISGEEKDDEGEDTSRLLEEKRRKAYYHRWHYRIVYKEYAIPYDELDNLDDMLLVLECAVKVLLVIHKAGWVHRDLSPGNLYLYIDPTSGEKRGLVGDLEFAKRVGAGDEPDGRTGTPNFMSAEIMLQDYQFRSSEALGILSRNELNNAGKIEEIFNNAISQASDKSSVRPFQGIWANYLHDLESLWWIMVWTFFKFHEDSGTSPTTEETRQKRRIQAHNCRLLFPGCMDYRSRVTFLYNVGDFQYRLNHSSSHFSGLRALVIVVRKLLLGYYNEEEKKGTRPIMLTVNGSLHMLILRYINKVPHDDVKISKIQTESRSISSRTRSDWATNNTGDGDQPVESQKPTNSTHEISSISSSVSGHSHNNEPIKEADGIRLRSGLRYGWNNPYHRVSSLDHNAARKSRWEAMEKKPRPDANRRITRSMTKKASAKKTTRASTADTRVAISKRSKTKVLFSKVQKRQ